MRKGEPHFQRLIAPLNTLQRKASDANELRNRVIHDPWFADIESKAPAQFVKMSKKQLRYNIEDRDAERIKATTEAIALVTELAKDLRKRVVIALEASRRKLR